MILVAFVVQCENAESFKSDFEQFKKGLLSMRDFDISKTISQTVFSNWTDNRECSMELDAIKRAMMNSEEWAFKGALNFCEQFEILKRKTTEISINLHPFGIISVILYSYFIQMFLFCYIFR